MSSEAATKPKYIYCIGQQLIGAFTEFKTVLNDIESKYKGYVGNPDDTGEDTLYAKLNTIIA